MSTFIGMILGYGIGYGLSYWLGYKNRGYLYNIGLCILIPFLTMLSGFLVSFVVHEGLQEHFVNISESKESDDDWDKLAFEVKAETEAQSVKRNLTRALNVNPDKQAEINRLSEKSGVPTFSIDSPENEAWVRSMTRMNDINPDEMAKTHPVTAKTLQDENATNNDTYSAIGGNNRQSKEANHQGHEMLKLIRQAFIFGLVGAVLGLRKKIQKSKVVS
ncbi:MAG TPA: hypothetical protein PLE43_09340 [Alphaproteobacteria bacterium]|nr:hypothetical protein [Alphaproteobacteria bacterium]